MFRLGISNAALGTELLVDLSVFDDESQLGHYSLPKSKKFGILACVILDGREISVDNSNAAESKDWLITSQSFYR
ncbi:MAG TPA: hypothetical protein VF074_18055 [Pyrinomonadaceae bacterium]